MFEARATKFPFELEVLRLARRLSCGPTPDMPAATLAPQPPPRSAAERRQSGEQRETSQRDVDRSNAEERLKFLNDCDFRGGRWNEAAWAAGRVLDSCVPLDDLRLRSAPADSAGPWSLKVPPRDRGRTEAHPRPVGPIDPEWRSEERRVG